MPELLEDVGAGAAGALDAPLDGAAGDVASGCAVGVGKAASAGIAGAVPAVGAVTGATGLFCVVVGLLTLLVSAGTMADGGVTVLVVVAGAVTAASLLTAGVAAAGAVLAGATPLATFENAPPPWLTGAAGAVAGFGAGAGTLFCACGAMRGATGAAGRGTGL